MNLAEQLFQNSSTDKERAIKEYKKQNKQQSLEFPSMVPKYDYKNKEVYCIYKPKDIDDLLETMMGLPRNDVDRNLERYGFTDTENRSYAYQKLGLTEKKKRKKKTVNSSSKIKSSSSHLSKLTDFFSFAFDTCDNAFVHLLNKETGETYFQPIQSLKDTVKLHAILQSNRFSPNVDLMYSLSTYKTMKNATEENVFSIPLIQVDVDYRKMPKYKNENPREVWRHILKNEVGKAIPHPSAIEYGHQLRLLYKMKDLYIKKGSNGSKNVARRISKVFAERLSLYGAEAQPITSHGRIPSSINSKDGSKVKVEVFGYEYEVETVKGKWLDPLPDWYPEWKSKAKRKGKVIYLHNTYTLNTNRLRDFFKIVGYFNGDLDGRKFLCLLVRSHALMTGYTPVKAKEMMFELNAQFKTPLKQSQIDQDTRNVERKQYLFKTEKILERLGITPEMEEKMQLETIISGKEKKRRNRLQKVKRYRTEMYGNPNISKRILIEGEKQRIRGLLGEGLKKKEICRELGIQPKTLQRRIKEMKKEGLL